MNENIVIWLKDGAHLDAWHYQQRALDLKATLGNVFPRRKIGDRRPCCSAELEERKAPLLQAAGTFTSDWILRCKGDLKREFRDPAKFYFCQAGARPSLLAEFRAETGWRLCTEALQAAGVDANQSASK